ncbi:MAG: hypothetical protein IH988_09515 [Planctomycetes bacterium]|nr:hypothetical protein [Planctomycetota bacterium]
MKHVLTVSMSLLLAVSVVSADPPGVIDGENIPGDFGDGNLEATQTNYTGFGDYQTEFTGGFSAGSETDVVFIAGSANKLYIGITGNLETNGHAWIIGIGVPDRIGQTENRAEGVGGPPYTLQGAGREVVIDDNGTPEDPTDDTWSYGADGTIFPCETDYVLAVDTFAGTASFSEYELFDPDDVAVGTVDPTPDNPDDPDQQLFTVRTFVGQTPTNDENDVMENDQFFGYSEAGFDNRNVDGVTDTDGSTAATASLGLEFGIPLDRLGLTGDETITIFVLLLDGGEGSEAFGEVVNQVLPPLEGAGVCEGDANGDGTVDPLDSGFVLARFGCRVGTGDPLCDAADQNGDGDVDPLDSGFVLARFGPCDEGFCDPPSAIGLRPDLTTLMRCLEVDLGSLPDFTGTTEGQIDASEYGGSSAAIQSCPTPYGDQLFDPEGEIRIGGSELNELYITSDGAFMYFGITGNLEENNNAIVLWLDVNGTDTGENVLDWGGAGLGGPLDGGDGMGGDTFGPLADLTTDSTFDYALGLNVGGPVGMREVYADWWDLEANTKTFRGFSIMESGSGVLDTSTGGDNPNGLEVALNNLNNDGVIGCSPFEDPCYFDDDATVAAAAATAVNGLEIAVPLTDLGLESGVMTDVSVWVNVLGGNGWRANQALPTLRGPGADQVQNQGNSTTFWYDPDNPDPLNANATHSVTVTVTPD